MINDQVIVDNYHNNKPAFFYVYTNCPISTSFKNNLIWETHLHEVFSQYITPESIVIEGGSHIGSHTIKLGMLAKHVFAFEPMQSSYNILEQNIIRNNLKNITLSNNGLSNSCSTAQFDWIPIDNPGGSGLSNNPMGIPPWFKKETNTYPVNLITIDSLQLNKLDFIKLDIEGYESFAISGGFETIKKYKPIITLESWVNHNGDVDINFTHKIFCNLIDIGYNLIHINGPDFLFLPI
jgi:FkbM family methyltransferase